jgi:hypothetical protein
MGHGFCMGHYHRFRAGKSFESPLSARNQRVRAAEKAVNTRISLEAWQTLAALAKARDVSVYQYLSDLLEAAARRRRHEVSGDVLAAG